MTPKARVKLITVYGVGYTLRAFTSYAPESRKTARALPIAVSVTPCLEVPNSRVAELHESGKALSLAAMRPLKADWTRFFPRRLGRVRRVVGDVANLRPVQGDLETRALAGDLDMPFIGILPPWNSEGVERGILIGICFLTLRGSFGSSNV